MPFMVGKDAFRNTLAYIQKGRIVFKHNVKVMAINYNVGKTRPGQTDTSRGIRDLVYWHINQLQYRNPQTQIVTLTNMTPSPFITFVLGNGQKLYVDVEDKSKDDILAHIRTILGKSDDELKEQEKLVDLSQFGANSQRQCMCEVPGQVACPAFVPIPKVWRGKWINAVRKGDAEWIDE